MSSPFLTYRDKRPDSDSESDIEKPLTASTPRQATTRTLSDTNMALNAEQLNAIVQAAVANALQEKAGEDLRRENELRLTIKNLSDRLAAAQITPDAARTPQIQTFEPIDIKGNVVCNEPLDAVKCLPEFTGSQETYVSWRQAAKAAYRIFEDFIGSSRHYQAVVIIRSKIRGPADAVLSSFGTVLNFDAIINRLDFTYSDKRPIHVIEQEMGTLRQGNLTLLQYYDEVEKKLTLLTNKVAMSYAASEAKVLCDKFRDDALRVFISGLRRNLTDVLFSAKPKDMPSALALAQEVESNHDRYAFATSFAKNQEDRDRKQYPKAQERQQAAAYTNYQTNSGKNPHYTKQHKAQVHSAQQNNTQEPMEVDPSLSRFRQPTQTLAHQSGRPATSGRSGPVKRQRVNHVTQSADGTEERYIAAASNAAKEVDDDAIQEYDSGVINFLGEDPCYPSSDEE